MIKIPDPVLILFAISSVLGFFLRFIKDGNYKQLTFKPIVERLGTFALVTVPFIGLLLVAQQFGVTAGSTLPYFAGAAVLSFVLGGLGIASYLRGILLLAATVALTALGPAANMMITLSSTLCGLLATKLSENIGFTTDSNFDDILPPMIWLSSVVWLANVAGDTKPEIRAAVILGILSVSQLMRFVQGPFVRVGNAADDRIFLKRVVLSISAGLGVLCVLVKMLNLVDLQYLALLCGAGYFVTYMYKDLQGEDRYSLTSQQSIRMLILIALLTLVATRFFGMFGLLALAPTALVAPLSSAALFPALFFTGRVLVQIFVQNFNQNVTGINLTHSWAGAAQFGGFVLAVVLMLLFKERMNRKVLLALTLGACIVTPVLSNFILHSEPTCSLFMAMLVAGSILTVVAPSLQNSRPNGSENLMLLTPLMVSSGILTSGLLEAGNEATIATKTTVLSYGIVFVLALMFVCWFFFRQKNQQPPASEATS
ncbi:MAG: hypothetical protein K2X77_13850 [Candidatus Obscuribacterales bacterium]|jgi:hypothetical protein|nr:hypothetical protein [Candidatus Obscuribacterales bacterium]